MLEYVHVSVLEYHGCFSDPVKIVRRHRFLHQLQRAEHRCFHALTDGGGLDGMSDDWCCCHIIFFEVVLLLLLLLLLAVVV
jgi:hypothetical protein